MSPHLNARARRIGVGLSVATGAIAAAALAGSPLAAAEDSPCDTCSLVDISPNGGPADVSTTGSGLFTDTTEVQPWATFVNDNGTDVLLTPQNIGDFPLLTAADIGSADVDLNLFQLAPGWGVAFTDVASAGGALSGNLDAVGMEFVTPLGDLPLNPAFGFIPDADFPV